MSRDTDQGLTVVVGAGLTGLVAANEWMDAGEKVVLLEQGTEPGGMARSVYHNGFTFDYGPHFILRSTVWQERLFEPEELAEFSSRIHFVIDGKWVEYPFGLKSLPNVPARVAADALLTQALGRNPFGGNRADSLAAESFAHRLASQWGYGLYEWLFRPYLEQKMGGVDMSETLHWDWWSATEHDRGRAVRPTAISAKQSPLARIVASAKRIARHAIQANVLHYPRGGFGQFGQRLTQYYLSRDGELRLNTSVDKLQRDEHGISAVETSDGASIPVKRLIWTASPTVLASLVDIAPIGLPTLHSIIYFVEFDKRYPRRGTEIRPLGEDMAFFRGYFPETICDGLAPEDQSGLVAEVGTFDEEEARNADAQYDAIIDTCVRLGLCPIHNSVTSITHQVVQDAYPIYPLDYERYLSAFYDRLAPIGNLILAGRNARFHYINSYRAMDQGERTREDRLF